MPLPDPSKTKPEAVPTPQEILQEIVSRNATGMTMADVVQFADDPMTLAGMLAKHGVFTETSHTTMDIPDFDVRLEYEMDLSSGYQLKSVAGIPDEEEVDTFNADDYKVTPEQEEAHYKKLADEQKAADHTAALAEDEGDDTTV